jgi:hypothetical protein
MWTVDVRAWLIKLEIPRPRSTCNPNSAKYISMMQSRSYVISEKIISSAVGFHGNKARSCWTRNFFYLISRVMFSKPCHLSRAYLSSRRPIVDRLVFCKKVALLAGPLLLGSRRRIFVAYSTKLKYLSRR